MNTITIQVEDNKVLAGLKKVLQAMNGVKIISSKKEKRCELDEAIEDIRQGRTNEYSCSKELFEKLGI